MRDDGARGEGGIPGWMLLRQFEAHVGIERNRSPNTVEAYRSDVERYLRHLEEKGTDPLSADAADVAAYVEALSRLGLAPRSVSRALSALRTFHAFLHREGLADANPAALVPLPALPSDIPSCLSEEEAERLLDAPSPDTPLGIRDRAMLELLYSCGLRISELCGLDIKDLLLEEKFVRVRGKGGKERLVPFGERVAARAEPYLLHVRPRLMRTPSLQALFLNSRGGRLGRVGAWKMVKKHARAAGITTPLSPHTLRHTFATHLIDNGADIRFVQQLLGHASITTTEKYTHVGVESLRRAYKRFHPLEIHGRRKDGTAR